MANKLQPIKGFRDFYPNDWAFQNWLKNTWIKLGRSFGYEEYEAPLLEPNELYLSKSSQEIIENQTFQIEDEKGKKIILRPELTPSLARMIAQKQFEITLPAKWQSYGRFFRYEQPQKGRGRSFFQWNIDLLGMEKLEADAEIITIACLALKNIGLTSKEVKIKINDRQLLEKSISDQLDIDSKKAKNFFNYLDKSDKLSEKEWLEYLIEEGISKSKANKLLTLTKDKDYSLSPRLTKIFDQIEQAGLSDYIEFDKNLVRGFQYYTKTVFEAWGNSTLNRALFGGGRYDNLTQQIGGRKKIPGVGFAIGDMPIYELLKESNKLPGLSPNPTKVLVTIFSPEFEEKSFQTAQKLRAANINTEVYLDADERLDKQLQYANKKNIPYIVIIGPEEAEKGLIALKKMSSGLQKIVSLKEIIKKIKPA